jgi:hypothetical protein
VDSLPERAGPWKERALYYESNEDEKFIVRYRDPIEAIKALLGDPSLADHIVYRPKKIFSKQVDEMGNRKQIRTEMWSGNWWWTTQVPIDSL